MSKTGTVNTITDDRFYDEFKPVKNHLLPNGAPFSDCMFETYGEELEYVRKQKPEHIWTIMDGDDGNLFIGAGYHLVNRIGYLITEKPWVTGDEQVIEDEE
jgi:hypothetical protein